MPSHTLRGQFTQAGAIKLCLGCFCITSYRYAGSVTPTDHNPFTVVRIDLQTAGGRLQTREL